MTAPLRRYAGLYAGFRKRLLVFLFLAIVQFLAVAPLPFVVKEIFDTAIADKRLGLLMGLAFLMMGLQFFNSAVGLFTSYWLQGISTEIVRLLRVEVFDKLYALAVRFYDANPIDDVHDRVVHETERVDTMTRNGFAVAVPSFIFATGILGILIFINWMLFLITVSFIPVVYTVNRVTKASLQRASRESHASVRALSEVTLASLRRMRQTRILGAETFARREEDEVLENVAQATRRSGLTRFVYQSASRMVIAIWVILILAVGGAWVIDGRLSLGELFSFYAGLALVRQPLDQLITSIPAIVAGREALDRIFGLLDVDELRPYDGRRRVDIEGRLSLQHVAYEYEEGQPVLIDVSLEVEPGEVIALMGPNGSGKSTLASLVLGFYRPTTGAVAVDGVLYREFDMRHLRRQFGVLTQNPIMIPGTVRENITYGRPDATEADLDRAIELAAAGSLIGQLEAGLDTRAYENGPLLSGGQLQRVALARALLGRPRLLILDEPTTHLDVEGLEGLLLGLRTVADAPAMILITHEQEVAAMADAIYHLQSGRLIRAVESRFNRPRSEPDAG